MSKLRILFLALALCAGPVSATTALAQTAPSDQAPLTAGSCIWGRLPQSLKDEALGKDTAMGGLTLVMETLTDAELEASAKACGVADNQFGSAGERLTRWVFRSWSEKRLEGGWTAARLDAAYRAIPAGDKALMKAAFARKGDRLETENAAFRRFFAGLGLDTSTDAKRVPGYMYLAARLRDEG